LRREKKQFSMFVKEIHIHFTRNHSTQLICWIDFSMEIGPIFACGSKGLQFDLKQESLKGNLRVFCEAENGDSRSNSCAAQ